MPFAVSGNSVRPIRLAGLLALATLALPWQQARAQNVRPMELTFVFRGGAMFNYVNGTGWKGIVGDKIDAGYTCYGESPQDKVVWKEGPPTVGGRIEVRCGNYHYCNVFQDDKRVHPNAGSDGDWEQVSYVELAAPAKP